MTFLLELREAAMGCSNEEFRALLRAAADQVEASLKTAYENPTTENMINLIGMWAFAWRVSKNIPPEAAPNPPLAPAVEEERKAA